MIFGVQPFAFLGRITNISIDFSGTTEKCWLEDDFPFEMALLRGNIKIDSQNMATFEGIPCIFQGPSFWGPPATFQEAIALLCAAALSCFPSIDGNLRSIYEVSSSCKPVQLMYHPSSVVVTLSL